MFIRIDLTFIFCDEEKINYTASMISNGYLLSKELAYTLKEKCRINIIQITIDGLPEYHNKRRILKNGKESFDTIVKNIDDCKDILRISVRVNVDKLNRGNLDQLTDYFINEKGWSDNPSFYVAPVVEYENNCGTTSCISNEEFILDDVKTTMKQLQKYPSLIKQIYPGRRATGCTACQLGNYVIDLDGELYTCYNVIGDKKYSIGNVSANTFFSNKMAKWILLEPDKKCYECSMLPICAGGCPYEKLLFDEVQCDRKLLYLKEKLKIIYELHKS